MVLKVKDLAMEMRGGGDALIMQRYHLAEEQIDTTLRKAFRDEKLSEVTIDLSHMAEGLNLHQLCTVHRELVSDYGNAGWKVEEFPVQFLKFTFTAPTGSL